MDNAVVDKTIEIRGLYRIKLPDAIIAATALINSLVLVLHNTKDFKGIESLRVVNPYEA
jgi:predicted nucleic acid-binding protein